MKRKETNLDPTQMLEIALMCLIGIQKEVDHRHFLVILTINSLELIASTWRMNHKLVLTGFEPIAQGEGKIPSYVLILINHNLEQTGRVHLACRYLYIFSFFKFTSPFVEDSYPIIH